MLVSLLFVTIVNATFHRLGYTYISVDLYIREQNIRNSTPASLNHIYLVIILTYSRDKFNKFPRFRDFITLRALEKSKNRQGSPITVISAIGGSASGGKKIDYSD